MWHNLPVHVLSAAILLFRKRAGVVEVLLVHPGGPFWRNKDAGAWSIPKGEYISGENPLQAAQREFEEESGTKPEGEFLPLGERRQSGGKIVMAWALEGDLDAAQIRSNLFTLEWPPKSGKMREFPEVDRAEWFSIDAAREKILKGQAGFLDQLAALLQR